MGNQRFTIALHCLYYVPVTPHADTMEYYVLYCKEKLSLFYDRFLFFFSMYYICEVSLLEIDLNYTLMHNIKIILLITLYSIQKYKRKCVNCQRYCFGIVRFFIFENIIAAFNHFLVLFWKKSCMNAFIIQSCESDL